MINKGLIALACIVFASGLIFGSIILRNDFSPRINVDVQADLVHAYFKVYNVSAESGISQSKLLSYIVAVNITNPSDYTLRLSDVTIYAGALIYNNRAFGNSGDTYLMPHKSRIVAFSQIAPVYGSDLGGLTHNNLYNFLVGLGFTIDGYSRGRGGATITYGQLHVNNITSDEYVYGSTFGRGHYLSIDGSTINTGWESGRLG